jgi:hypothetical protein
MRPAGVVALFVDRQCHVESTLVPSHAMRDPAALAKCASRRDATVAMKRRISCAVSALKRETVVCYTDQMTAHRQSSGGWAFSNVPIFARGHLTVGSTFVQKSATDRIPSQPIAPARLISFRTVLAARRLCVKSQTAHDHLAKIRYRTAQDPVEPYLAADTHARSDAIKASVHPVCKRSTSVVVADARPLPQSVIRALKSHRTA